MMALPGTFYQFRLSYTDLFTLLPGITALHNKWVYRDGQSKAKRLFVLKKYHTFNVMLYMHTD